MPAEDVQTEILSAQIGRKWVAFKDGADLSELAEEKIQKWVLTSRECTTGTLIEVGEKVKVPATSHAFGLSYNLAFAEVHARKVEGPASAEKQYSSDKPDRAFLETIPTAILTAYVNRADPSRTVTEDEFDGLKKQTPSGGSSTDSALS